MASPFFARLPRGSVVGSSIRSFVSPVRTTSLPQAPFARGASGGSGFHTSSRRLGFKTVEQAKSRYRSGPFSWKSGILFLAAGVGLTIYFRNEKARMERKRVAEMSKGVGRPKVGGPLNLLDHNGKERKDEEWRGKHMLVYFGFTHCPDICPEELDKMASMIDLVKKEHGDAMSPLFITCDPARDTPPVMKGYLAEFHPDLIGLTGTYDQIKQTCKSYRVYFSTPPEIKPGQDYLVDHSIYFYLMDPEGDFVEALGRQHTPEQAAKIICDHIKDWKAAAKKA
ncbi:SCO1/SenC-domain-containing protein [Tuber borchii]|uniref:SCO1/SenC-domain-containing protein n=1 Tax=Tuber borchii TaxID=42251 RepID=A0A2T7A5G4_TUBBO|nr:SCO1/SenC-domain-containing protein [Tuber borchii]